jgi:hypothetical protein
MSAARRFKKGVPLRCSGPTSAEHVPARLQSSRQVRYPGNNQTLKQSPERSPGTRWQGYHPHTPPHHRSASLAWQWPPPGSTGCSAGPHAPAPGPRNSVSSSVDYKAVSRKPEPKSSILVPCTKEIGYSRSRVKRQATGASLVRVS